MTPPLPITDSMPQKMLKEKQNIRTECNVIQKKAPFIPQSSRSWISLIQKKNALTHGVCSKNISQNRKMEFGNKAVTKPKSTISVALQKENIAPQIASSKSHIQLVPQQKKLNKEVSCKTALPEKPSTKGKVQFKSTHSGVFISSVSKKNPFQTIQHKIRSVNRTVVRDMKHGGVPITPKANITSSAKISISKRPGGMVSKSRKMIKFDAAFKITGITPLKELDDNKCKNGEEHVNAERVLCQKSKLVVKKHGKETSKTEIISLPVETNAHDTYDIKKRIEVTSVKQLTDNFISLACVEMEKYLDSCRISDKEIDSTIQRYEQTIDNYEMYCKGLLKFVDNFISNFKQLITPCDEQTSKNDCNTIAEKYQDFGNLAANVQNVVNIIYDTTQKDANVLQNFDGHIVDLNKQKSKLEQELVISNGKYDQLQNHLESMTSKVIDNVVKFEQSVLNCLELIEKEIKKDKDVHLKLLLEKDTEIVSLRNSFSMYQLKLQESEDEIALLSAEKENLEEIIKYRTERIQNKKNTMSFSEIMTEFAFANRNLNTLDSDYRRFYLQLLELIMALKNSIHCLDFDFPISITENSDQYKEITTSTTIKLDANGKETLESSEKEIFDSDITLHNVLLQFINILTNNVNKLKEAEVKFNNDYCWNQLSSVLVANGKSVVVKSELHSAYYELMQRLCETRTEKNDTKQKSAQLENYCMKQCDEYSDSYQLINNEKLPNSKVKSSNMKLSSVDELDELDYVEETENAPLSLSKDVIGIEKSQKALEREKKKNELLKTKCTYLQGLVSTYKNKLELYEGDKENMDLPKKDGKDNDAHKFSEQKKKTPLTPTKHVVSVLSHI